MNRQIIQQSIKKAFTQSIPSLINECNDNKDEIRIAIEKLKGNQVEDYYYMTTCQGLACLFGLIVSLIILAWSLWALVTYFTKMPVWARVLAIILLFVPGVGPSGTLITVYFTKVNGNKFKFATLL